MDSLDESELFFQTLFGWLGSDPRENNNSLEKLDFIPSSLTAKNLTL